MSEETKEISVFVDESGSFAPDGVDACSPYYLLCMVFHDQSADILPEVERLASSLSDMGFDGGRVIHAGPLIRREEDCSELSRQERIGIFRRMMIFIQKAKFKYRCFKVFKPYNSADGAIHDVLLQQILGFLVAHRDEFNACREIKVYYDNGQAKVLSLLRESFSLFSSKTQFVPNVLPERYRLFQVADVICTLELVKAKLEDSGTITHSEDRFFGGVKNLKKLYLKPLLSKLWQ